MQNSVVGRKRQARTKKGLKADPAPDIGKKNEGERTGGADGDRQRPTHLTLPEYTPPNVRVSGATAPDMTPWIHVEVVGQIDDGTNAGKGGVWMRWADWADDAALAKRRMRAANIHLFGKAMKRVIEEAQSVSHFPRLPLVEKPGWTYPHFALPSGEVFSPPDTPPAVILFDKDVACTRKGKGKAWREGVARLAAGQSILTFLLTIPFAAPLLGLSPVLHNPGFELAGPKRLGKSSAQLFVASVLGAAVPQHGRSYVIPANTTVNALEELTGDYSDLPIIIEEMGMYYQGESEKTRSRKMLELVMRLASGTVKARRGEPPQDPVRFTYLTSSNERFQTMFGEYQNPTTSAGGDRLLTIPVSSKRKFGIFDRLPEGCASGKEATRAIIDLIEDHHGLAMRLFLRKLVAERAANEAALRSKIAAWINEFREAVGVDDNVGSESSIADVFGLHYAAGKLAQEYRALPAKLQPLTAAAKVHSLNRAISGPAASHLERLHALALRRGVIHIDAADLKPIPDAELDKAPALILTERSGTTLLLLSDAALKRAFALPSRLFKDPEVKLVMKPDSDGRKKRTVSVRTNGKRKQERFYAFSLGDTAKE